MNTENTIPEPPVSDTPKVEAERERLKNHRVAGDWVPADFARTLELELAAAQRENAELLERNAFLEQFTPKTNLALCAELLEAIARAEAAEATVTKLREALEAQHKWHLDQADRTPVYFGDTIGQINAQEYSESELYKITHAALNP